MPNHPVIQTDKSRELKNKNKKLSWTGVKKAWLR